VNKVKKERKKERRKERKKGRGELVSSKMPAVFAVTEVK
jgi:hypothetical protein